MTKSLTLALNSLVLASLITPFVHAKSILGETHSEALKSGRVIVEFRIPDTPVSPGARPPSRETLIDAAHQKLENELPELGSRSIKKLKHLPLMALSADASLIENLSRHSDVVGIYEDKISFPQLAESNVLIKAHIPRLGGFNASGIAVAVLDTGVEANHDVFENRVVEEACFSTNDASQGIVSLCPRDNTGTPRETAYGPGAAAPCSGLSQCEHGTHVAGIVAGGVMDNDLRGTASGADIIAVQVFSLFNTVSACGSASSCIGSFASDQYAALDYILGLADQHTIAAVNMSFGGGSHASNCDNAIPPYTAIIEQLKSSGIATVTASGNNGYRSNVNFPSCISSTITTAATCDSSNGYCNAVDQIASYSNMSEQVDILAPGSAITSSIPNNLYQVKHGTSMAAPHAAGAFALMKQKFPSQTVDQHLAALQQNGQLIEDLRSGATTSAKRRIDLLALFDADNDNDSVMNSQDNCVNHSDSSLTDSNNDGYGNVCDADFNGDLTVDLDDLAIMKTQFFSGSNDHDLTVDSTVNFADLGKFKSLYDSPPGPSALHP